MAEDLGRRPQVGLSLALDDGFLRCALPLFTASEVDVLEWSFDAAWNGDALPRWASELLQHYADAGCLIGHGVAFSPLSGAWSQREEQWLGSLADELRQRRYRHITEHFGFISAGDFHRSAPLPVPLNSDTLRLGRERMARLAAAASCPIGLENLAFAFGHEDVLKQGEFLEALLAPIDGFLLLDLHNLYCQVCNFDVKAEQLMSSYPLERVRELHVSGGSWSQSENSGGLIRRDTHDDDVPPEVFEMLEMALARCPHVEAVILERMPGSFHAQCEAQFQRDFARVWQIARTAS